MIKDYSNAKDTFSRVLNNPSFDFNETAKALFTFQFHRNGPYRAYCQTVGAKPEALQNWQDIPAIPCDAFKYPPPLFCGEIEEASCHFLSSGTTQETKSVHYFRETESYERSIQAGWEHARLPDLRHRCFLFQHPSRLPHSSLAHMFETLARDSEASWLIDHNGIIDPQPLKEVTSPLLLFATSLTLLQFLEQNPNPPPLPHGSWIFQTGGFKNLGEQIDQDELYHRIKIQLGVSSDRVINEYGMTELSSQAYAIGPDKAYQCPPWMKFRVVDPETGLEQQKGAKGYLHLYDLANLSSVIALRTQDIASRADDCSFILHGRDPEALPRGCSRTQFSSSSPV